ncbi:MAG: alpha-D-ribose 1-methylphosphonate 5-triphosphate diphosphatase [Desulfoprunum sp.]|jgi:alpha-D-ribose 1-methylphosphonate 5-triphosphate diphosphatase|uniref:alpha-D-ribose 1-methylphosphonate 5-triphosphate diphosphatase n=1 Tax=Desulfoprunum sp. TaxID=2020866 RepID=UPI00068C8245
MLTENFDTYPGPVTIPPDRMQRPCAAGSPKRKGLPHGFVIRNAQVVTPEGVRENASLQVEDGRIAEIREGTIPGIRVIDASGNYLFPGFVDLHSDAIEKGIEPRPNTFFPVDIAVYELDKKIASCGITTMYHSLSFAELEVGLRNNNTAAGIIRQINGLAGKLKVNTKIHARFEITDLGAVPFLEGLIRDGQIDLFSFMDHSPGQGQFGDIIAFKNYYGPVYAKTDAEMDEIIERKLQAKNDNSPRSIALLIDLCRQHGIAIASHDDDSREKITWLKEMNIGVTEFPVNIEAVRAARELGIDVCLGSPNVVRGLSQARNLSAREAISRGYGDILCSDYSPMTMLHAVLTLERLGILPLHEAMKMVSLTPARAVGIADHTGSLEVGKEADMVLVDYSDDFPRVLKTFVAGREVFATC